MVNLHLYSTEFVHALNRYCKMVATLLVLCCFRGVPRYFKQWVLRWTETALQGVWGVGHDAEDNMAIAQSQIAAN